MKTTPRWGWILGVMILESLSVVCLAQVRVTPVAPKGRLQTGQPLGGS